jgi:hypothetical protein
VRPCEAHTQRAGVCLEIVVHGSSDLMWTWAERALVDDDVVPERDDRVKDELRRLRVARRLVHVQRLEGAAEHVEEDDAFEARDERGGEIETHRHLGHARRVARAAHARRRDDHAREDHRHHHHLQRAHTCSTHSAHAAVKSAGCCLEWQWRVQALWGPWACAPTGARASQ